MCIVGSIVIVINAPEQSSVNSIQDMKRFIISPGFLSYAGIVILGCIGVVVWIAPKYGSKSMMVYISICSLIGGLRFVCWLWGTITRLLIGLVSLPLKVLVLRWLNRLPEPRSLINGFSTCFWSS